MPYIVTHANFGTYAEYFTFPAGLCQSVFIRRSVCVSALLHEF